MNLDELKKGVMGAIGGAEGEGKDLISSLTEKAKEVVEEKMHIDLPDDVLDGVKEKLSDVLESGDKDKIMEAVKGELKGKVDVSALSGIVDKLMKK